MDSSGRLTDVLIEDQFLHDSTGLRQFFGLHVWADFGMKEIIKAIPGVATCYSILYGTRYEVQLDPRYDREFLKREIEAAIKINGAP